MERPLKRPRLSPAPKPTLEQDQEQDIENFDLQEARAQNDLRLKSIFEGIFEKYGQDFTDVGDEIDLQTGDIVVNNGHIHGMDREEDVGVMGTWRSDPGSPTPSMSQTKVVTSRNHAQLRRTEGLPEEDEAELPSQPMSIPSPIQLGPNKSRASVQDEAPNPDSENEDDRSSVDSLLDNALRVQNGPGLLSKMEAIIDKGDPVTKKANITAKESVQSQDMHIDRMGEAVEPVWRVPEISGKFSMPTVGRSRPKPVSKTMRPQSPLGGGSLWALPWKSRRATDAVKRKSRIQVASRQQTKYYSSPAAGDWSFAQSPDGSESDDPLQEDYEPTPTRKGILYIREKRQGPSTTSCTKHKCDYCAQIFSQDDYISHLRAMSSGSTDIPHDITTIERQLETIIKDRTIRVENGSTLDVESRFPRFVNTSSSGPKSKDIPKTNPDATLTNNKRARTTIGPEEARLIIKMRHVQGRKWKEILDHFPHKKLVQLYMWNQTHWNERVLNPPPLSQPWSKTELEKLERLKDEAGLTWPAIRAELPGRPNAEIEFKLLRLWAGDVTDDQTNGSIGS